MTFFSRHFIAAAVVSALALPALAQSTPATSAADAPAQTQSQSPQRMQQKNMRQAPDPARMQERHAQRLAAFKEKLQLTPEQAPAWEAFSQSWQPGTGHARLDRSGLAKMTTPERIDHMRALRAQRNAEADRRGEATKTFYAALTPTQQGIFDAQTLRMGHRQGGKNGPKNGRHAHDGQGHHSMHGGGMQRSAPPAPAPAQ